jgi:hypothetical protein
MKGNDLIMKNIGPYDNENIEEHRQEHCDTDAYIEV